MLNYSRVKGQPEKVVPDLGAISASLLESDAHLAVTIRQLNNLPENVKRRLYRGLIPPALLTRFRMYPIQWTGANKEPMVFLNAESNSRMFPLLPESKVHELLKN